MARLDPARAVPHVAAMTARILFVAPRFHTNLFFATKALVEAGHQVEVFAPKREPTEDYRFVTPKLFPRGTPAHQIRRAVHDFAPDLCLVRHARPVSGAVLSAARFGRYRVYHYDQRAADRPREWWKVWEWRLQGLPARRVTPKSGLTDGPRDPLATYLPWPVEAAPGVTRHAFERPLRVLCVGKLMQPRKNQDKLIAAIAPLLAEEKAVLTLVGSRYSGAKGAEMDHLARLEAAAAGSDGKITIRSDVPFAEMPSIYAAHDVCVLPAKSEPLGTSPIEAMAYGTVPILTRQCGTSCYITDGVDGFLTKAGDIDSLGHMLRVLAEDAQQLARMSDAALETSQGPLGMKSFVKQIENMLETRP